MIPIRKEFKTSNTQNLRVNSKERLLEKSTKSEASEVENNLLKFLSFVDAKVDKYLASHSRTDRPR